MSKFILLFQGYQEPTPEVMTAWQDWFAAVGESFVDSGNPLGAGREVTKSGSTALTAEMSPATGYCIVSAEDMDAAERLLEGCPIIDSARIYEAMAM